ncbi:shikimate kinase [uncultured Psychroserpens sp.]|uniref:shikimate kinase n=1 Tax=uncultured Psychroserpens sp. TaxID=255436 RepID=UPI00261C28E4|nr:shikimate kinase [uncultured Psychroserpens sp.]
MTLILVGYMGSGKSSVGKRMAELINYDFIDLDDYIEEKAEMSIKEIFKTRNEIFFRKLEHTSLKEVIEVNNAVIALGGGTPCYGINLSLIKNHPNCKIIYLKGSIKSLTTRLSSEKENRPLIAHLQTEGALLEFIGKHLFERAPFYEQSDIIIKTDNLSVDEVVASIVLELF